MEEKKLNLYEKIQAIGNEIRNIEKSLVVGSGSYSYKAVGDLDVTLTVKDYEQKHRVVSIPIKQELINSEIVRTIKNDGKESLTYVDTIKMTVRITDLDNTKEFIDIESFGKGIDSGDKGLGKASTYARKYALLNAYKIATGEDPDAEKSKEQQAESVDEKRNAVLSVFLKDNDKMISVLSHFNVSEAGDLTKEQIAVVYNQFKAKKLI
jgi:hypothetical protein